MASSREGAYWKTYGIKQAANKRTQNVLIPKQKSGKIIYYKLISMKSKRRNGFYHTYFNKRKI